MPKLVPLFKTHKLCSAAATAPLNVTEADRLANLTTKTSQELRMLSSVTINCQITKIVMNSGSQLSEL